MKIASLLCAAAMAAVSLFTGCTTPTQKVAIATSEAGNAYATYVLGKQGAPALKGLQDLAAALPLIPVGKVSANQLGVINAELQTTLNGVTPNSQLYSQVGSLISLVSQSQSSSGNPTAEQGILIANAMDVANGITNAIQFWQGQMSVKPTSSMRAPAAISPSIVAERPRMRCLTLGYSIWA